MDGEARDAEFSELTRRALSPLPLPALAAAQPRAAPAQSRPARARAASSSTPILAWTMPSPCCWRCARRNSRSKASRRWPAMCHWISPCPMRLRMVEIAGRTDIPVAVGRQGAPDAPAGDGDLCAWRERIGRRGISRAQAQAHRRSRLGLHPPDRAQISRRSDLDDAGPAHQCGDRADDDPRSGAHDQRHDHDGRLAVGRQCHAGGGIQCLCRSRSRAHRFPVRHSRAHGGPGRHAQTELTDAHVQRLEAAGTRGEPAAANIARNIIDRSAKAPRLERGPNMHDPLAMAAFLDPIAADLEALLCGCRDHRRTHGGRDLGLSPQRGGPARFAADPGKSQHLGHAARQIRAQCTSRHRREFAALLRAV